MSEHREGRPPAKGPACVTSTAANYELSCPKVPLCTVRGHDTPWPCPLHCCPHCLLEAVEHDDELLAPPALRFELDEDDPVAARLDELHDAYVYDQGGTCLICQELVQRAGWSRYPGWSCEASDCLTCEDCDRCMDTGRVCRWCHRCDEHELETGAACERQWWSNVLLEHVTYFKHSTYDRSTGRWSR